MNTTQPPAQGTAQVPFSAAQLEGLAKDLDRYTDANPGCSYFTNNDGARVRWLLSAHATHLARIKVLTDLLTKFAAEDSQCDMEGFRKLKQQARAALTPSQGGPV